MARTQQLGITTRARQDSQRNLVSQGRRRASKLNRSRLHLSLDINRCQGQTVLRYRSHLAKRQQAFNSWRNFRTVDRQIWLKEEVLQRTKRSSQIRDRLKSTHWLLPQKWIAAVVRTEWISGHWAILMANLQKIEGPFFPRHCTLMGKKHCRIYFLQTTRKALMIHQSSASNFKITSNR